MVVRTKNSHTLFFDVSVLLFLGFLCSLPFSKKSPSFMQHTKRMVFGTFQATSTIRRMDFGRFVDENLETQVYGQSCPTSFWDWLHTMKFKDWTVPSIRLYAILCEHEVKWN